MYTTLLSIIILILSPEPVAPVQSMLWGMCAPGGCCTWQTMTGIHCEPSASGACDEGAIYKACDEGQCMGRGCLNEWGNSFSDDCCSGGAMSLH